MPASGARAPPRRPSSQHAQPRVPLRTFFPRPPVAGRLARAPTPPPRAGLGFPGDVFAACWKRGSSHGGGAGEGRRAGLAGRLLGGSGSLLGIVASAFPQKKLQRLTSEGKPASPAREGRCGCRAALPRVQTPDGGGVTRQGRLEWRGGGSGGRGAQLGGGPAQVEGRPPRTSPGFRWERPLGPPAPEPGVAQPDPAAAEALGRGFLPPSLLPENRPPPPPRSQSGAAEPPEPAPLSRRRGAPRSAPRPRRAAAAMPVLKNPHKLKMANGEAAGTGGTLILEQEGRGTNPFEEDLEEHEQDFFLGSSSPMRRIPSPGDGSGFGGDLFSGSPEGRYRRRATLEKLVGLSPFRLGKGRKEKSPGGEKGSDRRSFLGRLMIPLAEGNQERRSPEKRKARRSSEDFSLLQLLNGRRKESLCSLDCGLAEKENGGGSDSAKRMSFLKIGLGAKVRRASLVEKPCPAEAVEPVAVPGEPEPKPKEPLSVLEILSLIQQRDLLTADGHIIELEAECAQDGQQSPEGGEARKDGSRKAKDVALLYEALLKELWAVLAEALAAKSSSLPLELMVRVIEQEEDADRRWLEAKGGAEGGPRPRALKRQWEAAVSRLVGQRLGRCVEGRAGPLPTQLDRLAKCAVEDLSAVKFHLLHAYPKEYQAFSVYLRSFHQGLASHLAEVAQRSLSTPELYFVLDWCSNIYQREVLGRAEIASLVKAQELGPLLSPETQLRLEEACIAAVQERIVSDMTQELQEEEERWAQAAKDDGSQGSLSSRVISVLKAHADKAPQITEGFGMRMAQCCLASLAGFLQSFQKKVDGFHEGQAETSLPADDYTGRTVTLVNCCPPFRAYVERLARLSHPESEAAKHQANAALDRVTRLCNQVLADQLFQKLKPYFHKLMKRKWLGSSEAFPTIMALLAEHAEKLSRMELQPYQMLVKEVHRRVLIEYVRPLMRVQIICTSSKMRGKVAQKLRSEARQLQEFFTRLESASSWLDSAVPHLAGIIELEDTPSIQMEVGFLASKFPDVQKQHLGALLDVRGLQRQGQRQDILAVLDSAALAESEASLCQDRAFFAEIPTGEVFCVRLQLHRASRLGHSCLARLRWGSGPRRPRLRWRREEHEAESQV